MNKCAAAGGEALIPTCELIGLMATTCLSMLALCAVSSSFVLAKNQAPLCRHQQQQQASACKVLLNDWCAITYFKLRFSSFSPKFTRRTHTHTQVIGQHTQTLQTFAHFVHEKQNFIRKNQSHETKNNLTALKVHFKTGALTVSSLFSLSLPLCACGNNLWQAVFSVMCASRWLSFIFLSYNMSHARGWWMKIRAHFFVRWRASLALHCSRLLARPSICLLRSLSLSVRSFARAVILFARDIKLLKLFFSLHTSNWALEGYFLFFLSQVHRYSQHSKRALIRLMRTQNINSLDCVLCTKIIKLRDRFWSSSSSWEIDWS